MRYFMHTLAFTSLLTLTACNYTHNSTCGCDTADIQTAVAPAPLTAAQLTQAAERYMTFLKEFGAAQILRVENETTIITHHKEQKLVAPFAPTVRKTMNSQVVATDAASFVKQLTDAKKMLSHAWVFTIQEIIPSADTQSATIRYTLKTEAAHKKMMHFDVIKVVHVTQKASLRPWMKSMPHNNQGENDPYLHRNL